MKAKDVSGRTVLDFYGKSLSPGDIVIAADNSMLVIGVFFNHFDNGSGWKARFRVPNSAYRSRRKMPYNPKNMTRDSYSLNATICKFELWKNNSKIADDARKRCEGVLKADIDIDCKAYEDAKKLRDLMIASGKIKVSDSVESPIVSSTSVSPKKELYEFGDLLSKLGAPKI